MTDLFELSNLQAGTTPFEPEGFALAELVHDVVGDYSPELSQPQAKVSVGEDCEMPASVHADIGLIERALRNLLDNARRHTAPNGRIVVTIRPDANPQRSVYWLKVSDDGEGIAAGSLPHIFESAWSGPKTDGEAESADKRSASDLTSHRTGLGLHIVRQIALLHGGEPSVESAPACGTCISFAVPAMQTIADDSKDSAVAN